VAVASAGTYASLHLVPDICLEQVADLPAQFFTGRMPFLPPNHQCRSTEGKVKVTKHCRLLGPQNSTKNFRNIHDTKAPPCCRISPSSYLKQCANYRTIALVSHASKILLRIILERIRVIRMTEDRDKWRKYVHGVANPRIEDG